MNAPESQCEATTSARTQPCSSCQRQFHCEIAQGKDHCWCMKLPAVLPVQAHASCLCEECLKRAIAERQEADADAITEPAPFRD